MLFTAVKSLLWMATDSSIDNQFSRGVGGLCKRQMVMQNRKNGNVLLNRSNTCNTSSGALNQVTEPDLCLSLVLPHRYTENSTTTQINNHFIISKEKTFRVCTGVYCLHTVHRPECLFTGACNSNLRERVFRWVGMPGRMCRPVLPWQPSAALLASDHQQPTHWHIATSQSQRK